MEQNYLSNDSRHGFYEKPGVWWPTVTHYIEGKKFEGTRYEHIIRECKTVFQVKRYTKERNIRIVTSGDQYGSYNFKNTKTYGLKRSGFFPKSNWREEYENNLKFAIKNKFLQNQSIWRKLLGTYPRTINCPDGDPTAKIITDLRDSHIKLKAKVNVIDIFSEECNSIRGNLMKISIEISKLEGWDRVFPGMVEDAIFNVIPKDWIVKNCFKKKKECGVMYKKYLHETRRMFIKLDNFQKKMDGPSIKITQFMFWCISKKDRYKTIANGVRSFMENGLGSQNKNNLQIRKIKRWYHKQ